MTELMDKKEKERELPDVPSRDEFEKRLEEMRASQERGRIESLEMVDFFTVDRYTYAEFKEVMEGIWGSKFERTYLRRLYRSYLSERSKIFEEPTT